MGVLKFGVHKSAGRRNSAIPGMGELMRQQVPDSGRLLPIKEVAGDRPVLAGLVMLQTDSAHHIAEREQEIIVVSDVSWKGDRPARRQRFVDVDLCWGRGKIFRPVGDHIEADARRTAGIEVEPPKVAPRDHR